MILYVHILVFNSESIINVFLDQFLVQPLLQIFSYFNNPDSITRRNQCLVVGCCPAYDFFPKFYFDLERSKMSLNRGTLVSVTVIYQMKCPLTVLSAHFLFLWMLAYDSRWFLVNRFFANRTMIDSIVFIYWFFQITKIRSAIISSECFKDCISQSS